METYTDLQQCVTRAAELEAETGEEHRAGVSSAVDPDNDEITYVIYKTGELAC